MNIAFDRKSNEKTQSAIQRGNSLIIGLFFFHQLRAIFTFGLAILRLPLIPSQMSFTDVVIEK